MEAGTMRHVKQTAAAEQAIRSAVDLAQLRLAEH
jgi:hypothetical protein